MAFKNPFIYDRSNLLKPNKQVFRFILLSKIFWGSKQGKNSINTFKKHKGFFHWKK